MDSDKKAESVKSGVSLRLGTRRGAKKKSARHGPKDRLTKESRKKLRAASYVVVPKGQRLSSKVIAKLERENYYYTLARAIDLARKYQRVGVAEFFDDWPEIEGEETLWRNEQENSDEKALKEEQRIERLKMREIKRRQRMEMREKEELLRRKYRLHPKDPNYRYIEGYTKQRHRITKARFMRCVDVPLFKEVIERNIELIQSPIWSETLNLHSLTFTAARTYKEHLQQFEVIVEALKQGIFDKPGCDDIPLHKIRRKKPNDESQRKEFRYSKFSQGLNNLRNEDRQNEGSKSGDTKKMSETKKPKKQEAHNIKRRKSFPPIICEEDREYIEKSRDPQWLEKVQAWLAGPSQLTEVTPEPLPPQPPEKAAASTKKGDDKASSKGKSSSKGRYSQGSITSKRSKESSKNKGSSKKGGPTTTTEKAPATPTKPEATPKDNPQLAKVVELLKPPPDPTAVGSTTEIDEEKETNHPYANYLTIKIPTELAQRKKFFRGLIEKKEKQEGVKDKSEVLHEAHDDAQKRHETWFDHNREPLQMLHEDDKDSDIWTITTTTTTASYASWRRLPGLTNIAKRMENLSSPQDNTLAWRILLLLIILWEIGTYVLERINDVYYNMFTFYLYRENIWHYEPGIMAPAERSIILVVETYVHLFVSMISLSIIHRRNECVSLLFAFSLMLDSMFETFVCVHDAVYLPTEMSWGGVFLNFLHLLWKSFSVCLFVAYHYYSAGYIRKAREFRHRKTKLHNHEINAKGKKGILKRRLAWNWMVRHARNTNLRNLKKKFPKMKDGNFDEDEEELAKHIRFSEAKELRLYAQQHNLNIGYPYNRLKDMKRYVFGELEKSDYTEDDEKEAMMLDAKKNALLKRRGSKAITNERWERWKQEEIERRKQAFKDKMAQSQGQGPKGVLKLREQTGPSLRFTPST